MMKTTVLILMVAAAVWAADRTVCASGCDYTSITQTLITASQPGDTITVTAGETISQAPFELTNKPGADWITIRSSKWAQLPDGYRPAKDDSRLATLGFATTSGPPIPLTEDPAYSHNCWLSRRVGNTVTVGYLHGGGLTCEARLADGNLYSASAVLGTITLLGNAIPSGGTLRVGLGTNGNLWISHKSDIAVTTHFTCTNCETGKADSWLHINYPENSIPLTWISYDTSGNISACDWGASCDGYARVWLSGPQANKIDMRGLYPGTYADAYKGPATGVHHWRFVGIHFRFTAATGAYYGQMFQKSQSKDYRYVPHHLEWDRCVFSQPKASLYFWRWIALYHGENILIRNTRFLNTQTILEGQAILTLGSEGPVIMENIEVDGSTENFMAGGDSGNVVGVPEVILKRSLMRKRLEQRPQMHMRRQTNTAVLALTTLDNATRCNAGTCTAYYEDTPYTFSQDSTITLTAGQAAHLYVGMSPTGVLTVGHNSGANITCAGDYSCLAGVSSRTGMAEYAMLYEWIGTAGVWEDSYYPNGWQMGPDDWPFGAFNKNLFELKMGKNVLVEGNVFRTFWANGQSNVLSAGPRNQYGQDAFVRIDGLNITRNKFASAHSGISFFGLDDMGGNTFGRGYRVSHNVFLDLNRVRWGDALSGGQGVTFGDGNLLGVSVEHNTFDTSVAGLNQNSPNLMNSILAKNNLWLWNGGGQSGAFVGQGVGQGYNCLWKADWNPLGYGRIGPTSEYRGNLNLSTGTYTNPSCDGVKGWGDPIWSDLTGRNFTANVGVESVTFSDHLTSISSPAVVTDNARIKTSSVYSVHNGGYVGPATTTGMDAGADVDWVETLTDGVQEGAPELARRLALRVEPGATGAVISVTTPDTVTVQVSTHRNMKAASLAYDSSTPNLTEQNRNTFLVGGLTPGTRYWFTVRTAGGVVKDRFPTSPATTIAALNVRLNMGDPRVADAVVEYGSTPSLGSSTAAVACTSGCTVRVPWSSGGLYYRWRYRDGSGNSVVVSAVSAASR